MAGRRRLPTGPTGCLGLMTVGATERRFEDAGEEAGALKESPRADIRDFWDLGQFTERSLIYLAIVEYLVQELLFWLFLSAVPVHQSYALRQSEGNPP